MPGALRGLSGVAGWWAGSVSQAEEQHRRERLTVQVTAPSQAWLSGDWGAGGAGLDQTCQAGQLGRGLVCHRSAEGPDYSAPGIRTVGRLFGG